jgi:RNA polymerase sigma-70 factor (ECF subfamily)
MAVPDEDADLVRSAMAGDHEAFAELVVRHKGAVLSRAARFARNPSELEDLGQETFLRIYRDLHTFRGDAPFGHWLSRITVRVCYDALRKRRNGEKDVSIDALAHPIADPSTGDGPSAQLSRMILHQGMSRLKPEERLVITLFELEDRSVREVAELTGWSETRVKVRAFRARQALKRLIGGDDERSTE